MAYRHPLHPRLLTKELGITAEQGRQQRAPDPWISVAVGARRHHHTRPEDSTLGGVEALAGDVVLRAGRPHLCHGHLAWKSGSGHPSWQHKPKQHPPTGDIKANKKKEEEKKTQIAGHSLTHSLTERKERGAPHALRSALRAPAPSVRVPVLSLQITEAEPSVSTAAILRTCTGGTGGTGVLFGWRVRGRAKQDGVGWSWPSPFGSDRLGGCRCGFTCANVEACGSHLRVRRSTCSAPMTYAAVVSPPGLKQDQIKESLT